MPGPQAVSQLDLVKLSSRTEAQAIWRRFFLSEFRTSDLRLIARHKVVCSLIDWEFLIQQTNYQPKVSWVKFLTILVFYKLSQLQRNLRRELDTVCIIYTIDICWELSHNTPTIHKESLNMAKHQKWKMWKGCHLKMTNIRWYIKNSFICFWSEFRWVEAFVSCWNATLLVLQPVAQYFQMFLSFWGNITLILTLKRI